MPPSSTSPTPPILSGNSTILDDHKPPQHQIEQQEHLHNINNRSNAGSPVLNLSKGDDVANDERDDDHHDVISHDSDRGMHDDNNDRHQPGRDEERLSEMDEDDMDKDECKSWMQFLLIRNVVEKNSIRQNVSVGVDGMNIIWCNVI